MKTDTQRGPLGTWLYRGRQAKGWTVDESVDAIFAATGHKVNRSTVSGLEGGHRTSMSPDLQAVFEVVYGPAPELPERQSPEERMKQLVKEAIMELVTDEQLDIFLRPSARRRRQREITTLRLWEPPRGWEPQEPPAA